MEIQKMTETLLENKHEIKLLDQKFIVLENRVKMSTEQFEQVKNLIAALDKKIDWKFAEVDKKFDDMNIKFVEQTDVIRGKILYPLFLMFMGLIIAQIIAGPVVKKLMGL